MSKPGLPLGPCGFRPGRTAAPLRRGGAPPGRRHPRSPEFRTQPAESWLIAFLKRVFAWLGALPETSPVLYWLILVGCVVLLVLIVAHMVWTVHQAFFVARRPTRPEQEAQARRQTSAAHREEAAGALPGVTIPRRFVSSSLPRVSV